MTYLIRPDDLGEVQVRRFSDELHLNISSKTHSWVLVVPNGDILAYIAEAFMHHHLDFDAEPLNIPF